MHSIFFKKVFFPKKNIVFISISIGLFLLFIMLSRLTLPSLVIVLAGIIGFWLFLGKNQKELLAYSLICISFFSIFYFLEISLKPWIAILLSSIVIYFIFSNFLDNINNENLKIIYYLVIILVSGEILFIIQLLETNILIKSLIITTCFYLFDGFLNLANKKKLRLVPILIYSIIFTVVSILLLMTKIFL